MSKALAPDSAYYHNEHAMICIGRCSLIRSLMKQANRLQQHYRKNKMNLVRRIHWVFSLSVEDQSFNLQSQKETTHKFMYQRLPGGNECLQNKPHGPAGLHIQGATCTHGIQ